MRMLGNLVVALAAVTTACVGEVRGAAMEWVTVGNAGNASDPLTGRGSVGYVYQVGKYEVTNAQYVEFLNAKAASDPLGLFRESAGSGGDLGGITRSGVSGAYTYAPRPGYENRPVVYVSWWDAVRYANWVNNGKGDADTETGSYALLGGTPVPSNAGAIAREAGAKVFLASEDEWYKAAYYDPAKGEGGAAGGYWQFPTRSDAMPASAPPPGAANSANYYSTSTGSAIGDPFWSNEVGAYAASGSAYGTFDQGGNVDEWTDTMIDTTYYSVRGGSLAGIGLLLQSDHGAVTQVPQEGPWTGFRLVSVPEPTGAAGAAFMGAAIAGVRRRRRMPRLASGRA